MDMLVTISIIRCSQEYIALHAAIRKQIGKKCVAEDAAR